MAGRISVKTYIPTVQCYLENEDIEKSYVLEKYREQEIPKTFTSPFTGMEFILIPAGEFEMGSLLDEKDRYDYEIPAHNVQFKNPFYMGKYPVTQKQWVAVMGDNPSSFKGDDRPVESVSWKDVQEFIKKLNEKEDTDKYLLPSEAEWEYACRAGTTTKYSFGDDESKLGDYAWYSGYSTFEEWKENRDKILKEGKTHLVGQKKPNPWGLYDMHGNVWEWVQDRYHSDYNGAPSDGSAWEDGNSSNRVIRGGSWGDLARYCRSASRAGPGPDSRVSYVGFRLLRKL
nr:formylglycine-generating enzyme family protein [Methanosarcina sp. MTP4]